jgi:hypothetical protein
VEDKNIPDLSSYVGHHTLHDALPGLRPR